MQVWFHGLSEIEKFFPSWIHIAVLIQLIIQSFSDSNITIPEHFQWLEKSVASASTLYCPNCCKEKCSDFEFVTKKDALCCAEFAEPLWNFPKYSYLQTKLQIVNYDTLEEPQIRQHEKSNSSNYYILDYHGKLPLLYFPYNICKYPDLVTVNLSDNNIQKIPNISCLSNLDTLDLSNNYLENINSSTFSKLPFLRYLDLSNNLISYIEPESFNYRPGSLMHIKLKRNRLKSFDITNIFLGFWFYEVDCIENNISKFTNKVKGKFFRKGELVGGGYIRMTSNNLSRIPTPKELGFADVLSTFKAAFSYALQFGNNPWNCDCSIGLYIKYVEHAARKFKGVTRHNVTCFSPPQLKGYVIGSSKGNSSIYDLFICNINMKNKCPLRCTCFQQPSKERVVVNCTFSNQTKLPSYVPDFDNLDIDLIRNQIKYVQFEEYLNRTMRIDLSYNDIIHIDHLIYQIKTLNYINLYKNKISFFDKAILQKSPCNLVFGEIKTKCSCEIYWIKTWLERDSSQNCSQNRITCDLKSEHIDASSLSKEDFCPVERNDLVLCIALPAATLLCFICFITYQSFKYEIKLIVRKIQNQSNTTIMNSEIDFDVYISMNIENNGGTAWAIRTLNVYLEQQGMKTCIPYRDFEAWWYPEDYQESQFQNIEWNHIWSSFKCEVRKNIVVINFDALDSANINDRRLKAFCRLGYAFEFCNFDHRLLCNIRNSLNPFPRNNQNITYYSGNRSDQNINSEN
ncbi:unnamed protein product [Mytilus coruscus]|uniref:TIR domain-containing protein n=1 Tax=Mytilus coruscus TaxID=42192 RepID=A0A6J8BTQ9_MYTCO|nr:unnamed protein product [Mytilus coruscus]